MKFSILISLLLFSSATAFSAVPQVLPAAKVKRNTYLSEAIIAGGDALSSPSDLNGVRWATNQGFERIVVDLSGEAPPYFQVGLNGPEHKITLSIHSIANRKVSAEKILQNFRKSKLISQAYLAPALEGDLATLEFSTHGAASAEAFYLVNPPRIVIDVRSPH